ncbi:MAG TPA: hypothetical protein VFG62_24430 [Rhodopila sp.]|jgi:hypothetical protein|nr:hypothetical protein [Rhodopila sp.]
MRAFVLVAAILTAAPVIAQAETPLAPLPVPAVPEGAKISDYLRAAQGAVAANQLGEAESALEMAQTRLLDRSVPLGQTGVPSDNPLIGQIGQARQALRAHDRQACLQSIGAAIAEATSHGL